MSVILYHTWEPGLSGNDMTSGGGGLWTKFLFEEFKKAGHHVYWFTHDAPQIDKHWQPVIKTDAAIFCWRWLLPNITQYEERNRAYDRQNLLIHWCIRNKVPFLIHDQDLKMTMEERDWVQSSGGVIATPSFFPQGHNEISLHFPNPYTFSDERRAWSNQLIYIGNNYERMDQTIKYVGEFSKHIHTVFYGNWVELGFGRKPEEIRAKLPHVSFGGRLPQKDVVSMLSRSRATIMLHKPEYGPRGFTTIRWAEAAAAFTLPFIPVEFALPSQYIPSLKPLIVSDASEMLKRYEKIDDDNRTKLIGHVRTLVNNFMSAKPWIIQIERMIT